MIHYILERFDDGTPKQLCWSREIQKRGDDEITRIENERKEMDRKKSKPMAQYVEWAKARELWS